MVVPSNAARTVHILQLTERKWIAATECIYPVRVALNVPQRSRPTPPAPGFPAAPLCRCG